MIENENKGLFRVIGFMAMFGLSCLNCESESRMTKATFKITPKLTKVVNVCTRCNEERKIENNDKNKFECVLCNKVKQIVFRQACRTTYNCLNCLCMNIKRFKYMI